MIKNKPLIGFFPTFHSLGELLPQLKIAKKYLEMGGNAIFFSHGGAFEHLEKEIKCEVIKLKPFTYDDVINKYDLSKIKVEKQQILAYDIKTLEELVKDEIEAFKKTEVDLILSSFNPQAIISTRFLKIPLAVLISGTSTSIYYHSGLATFPENYENIFTKILPKSLKKYITSWMLLNNKTLVKNFNNVAKKYNIKPFKTINEILEGDYTLICDDINFLGIKPTKKFPSKNFVGPVSMGFSDKKVDKLDEDILEHLKRPGRSILFMMGSYPRRNQYMKILDMFNQTDYNVIVLSTVRSNIKLQNIKENILLKKYIKSPQIVNKMVDLAIIHGGRGTVYNAAYSGKPSIGIPDFIEQQYNIDCLVRNGAGLRISGKHFGVKELSKAIHTIFNNYEKYLKNAQRLSSKLNQDVTEKRAVKRLFEIFEEQSKDKK